MGIRNMLRGDDDAPRVWLPSDDPGNALLSARHRRHQLEQRLHGLDAKRAEIVAELENEDALILRHELRAAAGPPRLSDHVRRTESLVHDLERTAESASRDVVASMALDALGAIEDVRGALRSLEPMPDVSTTLNRLEARAWKARQLCGLAA